MPGVERVLEKERALGSSIRFEDVLDEVAGVYPLVMRDEQMDAGSCGMVAGLIRDIPTVQGLINRIMRQAEDIICERPDEPVNRGGSDQLAVPFRRKDRPHIRGCAAPPAQAVIGGNLQLTTQPDQSSRAVQNKR